MSLLATSLFTILAIVRFFNIKIKFGRTTTFPNSLVDTLQLFDQLAQDGSRQFYFFGPQLSFYSIWKNKNKPQASFHEILFNYKQNPNLYVINECTYVCMYVFMHECMPICMNDYMYVCMYDVCRPM